MLEEEEDGILEDSREEAEEGSSEGSVGPSAGSTIRRYDI